MNKKTKDRINAIKSQLADLKRVKMGKHIWNVDKIIRLEDELKRLQDEDN